MLAVLVHGDDPLTRGGAHARQRGGMLAKILRQPDRLDLRVLLGQLPDSEVGAIRPTIMDQEHLGDDKDPSLGAGRRLEAAGDLPH